jgi:hypothetical protein
VDSEGKKRGNLVSGFKFHILLPSPFSLLLEPVIYITFLKRDKSV